MGIEILGEQWERPEEIIQIAQQREKEGKSLTSEELLKLKSRSFYGPILLLEKSRGEQEKPKQVETRNMYNNLRELDTIEDDMRIPEKERCDLMDRFLYILSQIVRVRRNNGSGIEDILDSGDMRTITTRLEGTPISEEEKVFVRHFGKGPVLRELASFDAETKTDIEYGVSRMATGMKNFLNRGEMQTEEQLRDYCFYVAGSIGEFLRRLVKRKDNVDLNEEKGQKFGEFLQLVNIMKNVREDYTAGRYFLPVEWRPPTMSLMYLMENEGIDAKEAREKMLEKMLAQINKSWNDVTEYILSIPPPLSGYKAFTLVPLITARETIQTMQDAGAEKVFRGDEDAIKPAGGIIPIIKFSHDIVKREEGKRVNEWLEHYKEKPENFSFHPKKYETWLPRYIKSLS
jgi:farnesyl-diphosphate farnesyltransferase